MPTTCKLIAKTTLGSDAASVTFGSGGTLPQTYTDLLILYSARSTRSVTTDVATIEFNGSSSNLSARELHGQGSTVTSESLTHGRLGYIPVTENTANTFGNGEVYIPNYAGSSAKSYSATGVQENNATLSYINIAAGLWNSTAAISSITIKPLIGPNFVSGSSFYLYGITKSA